VSSVLTIRAACRHWSRTKALLLLRQVVGARLSQEPGLLSRESWVRIPPGLETPSSTNPEAPTKAVHGIVVDVG